MSFDWNHIIGPPVSIPADHWNPEKAETAQSDTVTLMGVMINSRYGKHHELELMCRIIAALPPNVRSEIKLFWCDSKATCSYSAIVKRPLNAQTYEMVGREIHDAACSFGGDHNGIDVGYSCEDDALWGDDEHRYSVHPHWNGDASCG